jgi:hypothetical protein
MTDTNNTARYAANWRLETGLDEPKIVRLIIANPLIMKERRGASQTPDLTLRSQFWWMRGLTACICRMTEWPAFWLPMETRTLSP